MNFFVYVYLDPRKQRKFKYGDLEFDYEPFYVGKGLNNRYDPYNKTYKHCQRYLKNKIKKIGDTNVLVEIPFKKVSESTANIFEMRLIEEIGRSDLKLGPLINMTNGGEGNAGRIFSKEHRNKLSIANKGKSHPGYWKGKKIPKEICNKISKANKGKTPWNKGLNLSKPAPLSDKSKKSISKKNSGYKNGMATLSKQDVLDVRWLYKNGISNKQISETLNISYGTIYGVTSRRTYNNVE